MFTYIHVKKHKQENNIYTDKVAGGINLDEALASETSLSSDNDYGLGKENGNQPIWTIQTQKEQQSINET